MSDNVVSLRDPNKIIRNAVIEAQNILAMHVRGDEPDAHVTINRLLHVLGDQRLVRAAEAAPCEPPKF